MVSRRVVRGFALASAMLVVSCRCSNDEGSAPDDPSGGGEDDQTAVTTTGEKLVERGSEPEPAPPPLLPGETRRPRGKAPHPEPTEPDPSGGEFTLEQATEGLEGAGQLRAVITADLARFECTLFADKAPRTVANFVGLARGKRAWWDPFEGAWVRRPYYNGLTFHEVIPGSHIRGGCLHGDGSSGPGYRIDDEISEDLSHDRAGVLSMASDGPNTNGAQFIVLDGTALHLNGRNTAFGFCEPATAIFRIARVPQAASHRPLTDVMIRSVRIERGE